MPEVGLLPIARVALQVSSAVLPTYRTRFSKHQFTQPQQRAALCLMRYEDWTFREAEVRLREHSELRRVRAEMRREFPRRQYSRRALIETVISVVKRKLSARAPGRTLFTQLRQALLLGLAFNIYKLRHPLVSPGCQQSQIASPHTIPIPQASRSAHLLSTALQRNVLRNVYDTTPTVPFGRLFAGNRSWCYQVSLDLRPNSEW